jgi:recombination protein RecT
MKEEKNTTQAVAKQEKKPTTVVGELNRLFNREQTQKSMQMMLGSKTQGFVTSVLSAVNNNALLKKCNPDSIYTSALAAASMDLPINPNLGFAALVPYKMECTFQIMAKGLTQLAIRTGQYKNIEVHEVYEGEITSCKKFRGEYEFGDKTSDKVVGYMAYFSLMSGFEKYLYMTVEEIRAHGKRYSKAYNIPNTLWQTNFDAMAKKTVLKLLLSKYGILSIEMQRAIKFDQGKIKNGQDLVDIDDAEVEYLDNENDAVDEKKAKEVADKFKDFPAEDAEVVNENTGEIFGDMK